MILILIVISREQYLKMSDLKAKNTTSGNLISLLR